MPSNVAPRTTMSARCTALTRWQGLGRYTSLTLALVVILMAAVPFANLLYDQPVPQPISPQTATVPFPTTFTTSPRVNHETAIYEDVDEHFSVSFPKSWYYETNQTFDPPHPAPMERLTLRVALSDLPHPLTVPPAEYSPVCRFDIFITSTSGDSRELLLSEQYTQFAGLHRFPPTSQQPITIGGLTGIKRTYNTGRGQAAVVLLPSPGKLWVLYFWYEGSLRSRCESGFRTILASFRITV